MADTWDFCTQGWHFTATANMASESTCRECSVPTTGYDQARYHQAREWLSAKHTYCAHCGERRLSWLEFAHFKREEKTLIISPSASKPRLEAELRRNVRSLCVDCHMKETMGECRTGRSPKAAAADDVAWRVLLEKHNGRCQCGQPECDIHVDDNTPVHRRRLMDWDHQPQYEKTATIATIKGFGVGRANLQRLHAELDKCVPLFKPHHRIITKYRKAVDPMYQAGALLPLAWRQMFTQEVPTDLMPVTRPGTQPLLLRPLTPPPPTPPLPFFTITFVAQPADATATATATATADPKATAKADATANAYATLPTGRCSWRCCPHCHRTFGDKKRKTAQ